MPQFTSPPKVLDYNIQVWEIVRQIPVGKVTSYGRIAVLIAAPTAEKAKAYRAFGARWVGGAMAKCPDDVPWWRVVNAQGKISRRPNALRQRELLEDEGVIFDEREKIDLKVFLWEEEKESDSSQPTLL
ncbi:MAG: cysteine methyltransferase [Anaerolineae bacterium]|jgi:methylated-DNA-protein-cysteine methyltransferase-like protein|nr:cysteine methyltransferase [Anaerolineae bacterium]MBT3714472.1 cysteine methyltransferase [Anaerolineae bacterium]MBT4311636.1 cysteine methyltransferase [Anaerolineae bacterium]MBT4459819.1 cysteine methyltransferase [Anaerolineae bacterium]MBT4843128.1 cysteine methyltransferase [Anaerolineae bacterium]